MSKRKSNVVDGVVDTVLMTQPEVYVAKKTLEVVNEVVETGLTGTVNTLSELEDEYVDKGSRFGMKLVVIMFLLMLLIILYKFFVVDKMPLLNF